jgi:hypothetical protein
MHGRLLDGRAVLHGDAQGLPAHYIDTQRKQHEKSSPRLGLQTAYCMTEKMIIVLHAYAARSSKVQSR